MQIPCSAHFSMLAAMNLYNWDIKKEGSTDILPLAGLNYLKDHRTASLEP